MRERVLITGANRGIGLGLVEEFLERGCRVVAVIRGEASGRLRELSESHSDDVMIGRADVTDDESVRKLAVEVEMKWEAVDILVNNAAVFLEGWTAGTEEVAAEVFTETFETNVVGCVRMVKAFLPILRSGDRPRIVNVSSGAGSVGEKDGAGYLCYGTSKAALNYWTRNLSFELQEEGITVVAMSPGWVRTDMGGEAAELTVEESTQPMVRSILHLDIEQTGQFMGRDGRSDGYMW